MTDNIDKEFDEHFQKKFDGGLVDIKFTLKPNHGLSVREIKEEIMEWQRAIADDKVVRVEYLD